MIFTGAVTSFIMGLKNKNPYRNVIAVDLNIALVLIPLILFGTMVGCTLNKVTPPWIILVCLTVVLVVNTWKTLKKYFLWLFRAFELWNKETKEINEKENVCLKNPVLCINRITTDDKYSDEESTLSKEDNDSDVTSGRNSEINVDKRISLKYKDEFTEENDLNIDYKKQIVHELWKDNTVLNIDKLVYLFIGYLLLLIITLAKGSEHVKSIIGIDRYLIYLNL